jgi:hypothetical protein
MNEEEVNTTLALWKILQGLRHGSKIECNDPLFAPRPTIPTHNHKKTLHVIFYGAWGDYIWMEHGTEFQFTGRIMYKVDSGDFKDMLLEITYEVPRTKLFGIWERKPERFTEWKYDYDFDDKYPHENTCESIVVEC